MREAVLALPVAVVALGAAVRGAASAHRRAAVAGRLPGHGPAGGKPAAAGAGRGFAGRLTGRIPVPPPPRWLARALVDAAVDVRAATAWAGWLAAAGAGGSLALMVSGGAASVLVVLGVGGLPPLVLRARRGRADARVEKELPAALESIARSLRSGASVRQAIGEAAQSSPPPRGRSGARLHDELATVAEQARHGTGLVEALEGLAARRPRPGVRLAVAALCLGIDTGGAQARAVDGVAATIRERLAVEAEVRALSSQARMSALVIGLAPLGFGAFAAATDPRTSDFLLRTPGGLILVCAGLLLDGAGWLWMQRLCRVSA